MATLKEDALIVAGIGLGVVLVAWYLKTKVSSAIGSAPRAVAEAVTDVWDASVNASKYVNPASQDNVFYRAQTGMYQWMTGSTGTIGGDFYDATHGGILSNGTFNPTSPNNAIYSGITNALGGESLGSKIYDWLH